MADRFELFHVSCLPRFPDDLFGLSIKREEYLRKVFMIQAAFESYGSDFHYVPAPNDSSQEAIVGRIGRHLVRHENKPPSEGLAEFDHATWRAAVLMLDPREHEDGQKLAVQDIAEVGKPSALIRGLVRQINESDPKSEYFLEVSQLIEPQSFWDFVKENRGKITSVSFDFIPPNMLGGEQDFLDDMRNFRDQEKARKVKLSIANEDGLVEADTTTIRNAVEYARRGGGSIRARAKGNKHYNSRNEVKRSYVEDVIESGEELVKVAIQLADRILGRK